MSRYDKGQISDHYASFYTEKGFNQREYELYKKYLQLIRWRWPEQINYNRLLDLGCGNGVKTAAVAVFFKEAVAIDMSPGGIEQCKKLFGDTGIDFRCGDAYQLEAGRFEVITAFGFSLFNEENPELLAERFSSFYQLFAADKAVLIASSFTDFSGTAGSGWVMHSRQQLQELEAALRKRNYRLKLYFPHKDVRNYVNFGFLNGLKEMVKFVSFRRKTFFFLIDPINE